MVLTSSHMFGIRFCFCLNSLFPSLEQQCAIAGQGVSSLSISFLTTACIWLSCLSCELSSNSRDFLQIKFFCFDSFSYLIFFFFLTYWFFCFLAIPKMDSTTNICWLALITFCFWLNVGF